MSFKMFERGANTLVWGINKIKWMCGFYVMLSLCACVCLIYVLQYITFTFFAVCFMYFMYVLSSDLCVFCVFTSQISPQKQQS